MASEIEMTTRQPPDSKEIMDKIMKGNNYVIGDWDPKHRIWKCVATRHILSWLAHKIKCLYPGRSHGKIVFNSKWDNSTRICLKCGKIGLGVQEHGICKLDIRPCTGHETVNYTKYLYEKGQLSFADNVLVQVLFPHTNNVFHYDIPNCIRSVYPDIIHANSTYFNTINVFRIKKYNLEISDGMVKLVRRTRERTNPISTCYVNISMSNVDDIRDAIFKYDTRQYDPYLYDLFDGNKYNYNAFMKQIVLCCTNIKGRKATPIQYLFVSAPSYICDILEGIITHLFPHECHKLPHNASITRTNRIPNGKYILIHRPHDILYSKDAYSPVVAYVHIRQMGTMCVPTYYIFILGGTSITQLRRTFTLMHPYIKLRMDDDKLPPIPKATYTHIYKHILYSVYQAHITKYQTE